MRYSYYTQVAGCVFVFNISNPVTLDELKNIFKDAQDATNDDLICVIAANCGDLRQDSNNDDLIPLEKYKDIEKEFNCKVIETSAKTGQNVTELFTHIIKLVIDPKKDDKKEKNDHKKEKVDNNEIQNGGCCLIE